MTTATLTTIDHNTSMSEFTSKAQMSLMLHTLGKETTANADTQTDDDKVTHAMSHTKGLLAKG